MQSKCKLDYSNRSVYGKHCLNYFISSIFRYPNVAKGLFCSLFGIFSALTLAIAVFTKFVPTYDVLHELGTDLYIAPWTRVIPYLIGVGAGYVLFSSNGELTLQPVSSSIE